jgi:N,N'-diacetyllegionaminate synthase
MKQRFVHATIGHSDHTPTLYTCYAAVTLGAKIIEKHVIVDKSQPGPDQSVSINFTELAELVRGIRIVEAASGTEKKVHEQENQIRRWAFRSIVTCRELKKGDVISATCIWSKRPGTGIPSKEMPNIIGKRVIRDVPQNVLLSWEDIT